MITINTNKILIPIDFSETSLRAIKHGAFIAKQNNGELILLHVQRKNELLDIILPAVNIKDVSVITNFLEDKLEKMAADIQKQYGIPVSVEVSMGNITSEIVNYADETGCGLIVMGTQGSDSENDILFLGSNAYRTLTKSDIPVMAVRTPAEATGYGSILIPVDASPHSRQKVNATLEFASKFASHVHVLGILGKDEADYEYKLKVIIPQIQKLAKEKNLSCTGEIIFDGDFAHQTIKYAEKIKADLIVCMRDESRDFPRSILGTYAHTLLNDSKIPVLCIPPEEHPEDIGQDSIGGMW
jgi:nucleotide-binding universal stress UspA family protein